MACVFISWWALTLCLSRPRLHQCKLRPVDANPRELALTMALTAERIEHRGEHRGWDLPSATNVAGPLPTGASDPQRLIHLRVTPPANLLQAGASAAIEMWCAPEEALHPEQSNPICVCVPNLQREERPRTAVVRCDRGDLAAQARDKQTWSN